MSITIVGLGPGDPELLTREAENTLAAATTLYLRTRIHPTVAALDPETFTSFDDEYDHADSFDNLYEHIAQTIVTRAADTLVTYAVPGHPLVAERTVTRIQALASERGIPVRIVAGLSFIEPVLAALGVDPLDRGLQIVDAHRIDIDPFRPVLLAQVYDRRMAGDAKLALMEHFPDDHPTTIVFHAGTVAERVETVPLFALDRRDDLDHLVCVYLAPIDILAGHGSSQTFAHVVRRLRRECPWDRQQTHETLRRYLIEETYEAADAIDAGDWEHLAEELGDVLLQVYLHATVAEQAEEFTLADIYRSITEKMIRRHPHVFGDVEVESASDVEVNWDAIKRKERGNQKDDTFKGITSALPALLWVLEIQKKAKKHGFEWPDETTLLAKLDEELHELRTAPDSDNFAWELGDVLFVLVDLARWHNLTAEDVLRQAGTRFMDRFRYVESLTEARGLDLASLDSAAWIALWKESKVAVGH